MPIWNKLVNSFTQHYKECLEKVLKNLLGCPTLPLTSKPLSMNCSRSALVSAISCFLLRPIFPPSPTVNFWSSGMSLQSPGTFPSSLTRLMWNSKRSVRPQLGSAPARTSREAILRSAEWVILPAGSLKLQKESVHRKRKTKIVRQYWKICVSQKYLVGQLPDGHETEVERFNAWRISSVP